MESKVQPSDEKKAVSSNTNSVALVESKEIVTSTSASASKDEFDFAYYHEQWLDAQEQAAKAPKAFWPYPPFYWDE